VSVGLCHWTQWHNFQLSGMTDFPHSSAIGSFSLRPKDPLAVRWEQTSCKVPSHIVQVGWPCLNASNALIYPRDSLWAIVYVAAGWL
jgi:hypothetical protein